MHINISSVVEFQRWWVLQKQDFGPRINIIKEKKVKIPSLNDSSSKIGHDFRKYSGSKIEVRKKMFFYRKWSPKLIFLNVFFFKFR